MLPQRRVVAALVLGVLMVTAGCNVLVGDQPLEFTAAPATVEDATLRESEYEEVATETQTIVRNFSAAGRTRQANVTNQLVQYERQVNLGVLGTRRAAVAVTFTSPRVTVVGQDFNPIKDLTTRELLSRLESQYESIQVGQQVAVQNVTSLGEVRTLRTYEGTADLGGRSVPVYIQATSAFAHADDYVVFVAIYPQQLDGEEQRVLRLFRNLSHPA
ncbi:MAG: DUF6517 family protein [Halobacteriaceae archaeon]